jgi:hypothetical protein
MEALNYTKYRVSESTGNTWIKLTLYGIYIRICQMTYGTLLQHEFFKV